MEGTHRQNLSTFFLLALSSVDSSFFCDAAATRAKYWITFFVFSVLPAPDSPLRRDNHIESENYACIHVLCARKCCPRKKIPGHIATYVNIQSKQMLNYKQNCCCCIIQIKTVHVIVVKILNKILINEDKKHLVFTCVTKMTRNFGRFTEI